MTFRKEAPFPQPAECHPLHSVSIPALLVLEKVGAVVMKLVVMVPMLSIRALMGRAPALRGKLVEVHY